MNEARRLKLTVFSKTFATSAAAVGSVRGPSFGCFASRFGLAIVCSINGKDLQMSFNNVV